MKTDRKTAGLAALGVFRKCTDAEIKALGHLSTQITVGPGHELCKQGTGGHEAFVILDGEADVSIDGTTVATVSVGEFVGEMALLDGGPRVGTVTAKTSMTVLVLNRGEFTRVLETAPHIAIRLLEDLGRRLREAESH